MACTDPVHDQSVRLNPGILRARRSDTPGAREDLPRDEKRDQRSQSAPAEGKPPRHQKVLMRSESRIRFMIDVVLDQRNRVPPPQRVDGLLREARVEVSAHARTQLMERLRDPSDDLLNIWARLWLWDAVPGARERFPFCPLVVRKQIEAARGAAL